MVERRAVMGLGSNLGDRLGHLQGAVDGLGERAGDVVAVSRVYETAPVGPDQPDFLNAVVVVVTDLTPHELLEVAQELERAHERVRTRRWGPRTLDVDVLLIEGCELSTPDLVVPHPRIRERDFVLAPLHDVAPELVDVPDRGWRGVRLTSHALTVAGSAA